MQAETKSLWKITEQNKTSKTCEISGFRRDMVEAFALLGCFSA
jgi:hypothetical protein